MKTYDIQYCASPIHREKILNLKRILDCLRKTCPADKARDKSIIAIRKTAKRQQATRRLNDALAEFTRTFALGLPDQPACVLKQQPKPSYVIPHSAV
jgi:hypothetical protein